METPSSSAIIPFSEPPYLNNLPSPYYTPSHLRWQKTCRSFITENLTTNALEWEREGLVPASVFSRFAEANFLVPTLPAPLPIEWCRRLGLGTLAGGLRAEEFDYLHFLIYTDEMSRNGLSGPTASITTGLAFGVPPILKFGSMELQERVIPDLLTGKARACIAITEPGAGSDVAGIETTAVKTDDGKEYIVNGQKKWITNGIWADYATTAVRTGGPGPQGLSLLLIPLKNNPSITLRELQVMGLSTSGTTYITFEDVRVPASNLIGKEGSGMKYIMTNFNHERLTIAVGVTRQARVALSSALDYVIKREAFGKPLVEQPVVRHRLAKVGAMIEGTWAWLEQISYQMSRMTKEDADRELGGLTGLVKASAARVFEESARCAVLLLGGNGQTKSGRGELIERIYRDVPGAKIPGGSEDVLYDLAIRELVKGYKRKIRELEKPSKL